MAGISEDIMEHERYLSDRGFKHDSNMGLFDFIAKISVYRI